MSRDLLVILCGAAPLIAAAVVIASRNRQPVPPPEVPVAVSTDKVRVKAVERKTGPVAEGELAAPSEATPAGV